MEFRFFHMFYAHQFPGELSLEMFCTIYFCGAEEVKKCPISEAEIRRVPAPWLQLYVLPRTWMAMHQL